MGGDENVVQDTDGLDKNKRLENIR